MINSLFIPADVSQDQDHDRNQNHDQDQGTPNPTSKFIYVLHETIKELHNIDGL